jgi:hypothetical protein
MGRSPGRRREIFYLQRCQQRLLRRARPAPHRKSDLGTAAGKDRDRPAAEYHRKLRAPRLMLGSGNDPKRLSNRL